MNILRDSELVIFSHSTTLSHFPAKFSQVFFSNSCKVRRGKNRKWRWIFVFDRGVTYMPHSRRTQKFQRHFRFLKHQTLQEFEEKSSETFEGKFYKSSTVRENY